MFLVALSHVLAQLVTKLAEPPSLANQLLVSRSAAAPMRSSVAVSATRT